MIGSLVFAMAALVAPMPSAMSPPSSQPAVAAPSTRPVLRLRTEAAGGVHMSSGGGGSRSGGAGPAAPAPPVPAALPGSRALSPASAVSVASVLLSTFLNLLGFTMTIPINVALRDHFGLGMGASFGSLSSAYPLGTFGALFLWPRLSDRVGRRPVMALSLGGTGLGLALQAVSVSRGWPVAAFLGCRFLTGCCAGASPVGKALLADIGAATGQLPRFMAWRDASTTMAFILGPLIGGWLFESTG